MKPAIAIVAVGALAFAPMPSAQIDRDPRPDVSAAPVALLLDASTGQVLHASNETRRFIPASITKVMSAYVAFEMMASGELRADQQFAFSEEAAKEWRRTGSTMFLEAGEMVPVDRLLQGITSVSANDASIVLAEGAAGSVEAWVDRMNATARDIGMRDSHFGTPNGWPDDGKTFTTARDLAILGTRLVTDHPDLYARYFGKEGMRHNGFAQANHDPISGVVPGADGIKTGFTNQAGHGFLGSAERDGTRLLMVLAGIDEESTRARMSRELIEWGFTGFTREKLFEKSDFVGYARVQNGEKARVALVAPQRILASRRKGAQSDIRFSIRYQGPVEAPITAGEEIAYLHMTQDGKRVARIPLAAAEDVNRAGFLRRIANAFEGWFI